MAGQLRPHDVLVYVKEELIELATDKCLFIFNCPYKSMFETSHSQVEVGGFDTAIRDLGNLQSRSCDFWRFNIAG